jgi:hypothetical protein
MRCQTVSAACLTVLLLAACSDDRVTSPVERASSVRSAASWGPESPPFNLEAVLRGDDGGFGLVRFRQPNDGNRIVHLDVWVRELAPNSNYRLRRAVDTQPDGICSSSSWLTLGKGRAPATIDTDARGTGRAELFRDLGGVPVGTSFDIHFQVVDATTGAVVLSSGCYRFTTTQ